MISKRRLAKLAKHLISIPRVPESQTFQAEGFHHATFPTGLGHGAQIRGLAKNVGPGGGFPLTSRKTRGF